MASCVANCVGYPDEAGRISWPQQLHHGAVLHGCGCLGGGGVSPLLGGFIYAVSAHYAGTVDGPSHLQDSLLFFGSRLCVLYHVEWFAKVLCPAAGLWRGRRGSVCGGGGCLGACVLSICLVAHLGKGCWAVRSGQSAASAITA